jgi:hypothetical protein
MILESMSIGACSVSMQIIAVVAIKGGFSNYSTEDRKLQILGGKDLGG